MKKINPTSPLTLGIVAILFGLLLIYFAEAVPSFIVMATGITLIVTAIIQQIAITRAETDVNKSGWKTLSLSAILLLALGTSLVAFSDFWADLIVTIIGLIILLLSVAYIMQIVHAKKLGLKISPVHYVIFVVLLAASIIIIQNPAYIKTFVFELTGGIYIFCGALQLANYFTFKKVSKLNNSQIQK